VERELLVPWDGNRPGLAEESWELLRQHALLEDAGQQLDEAAPHLGVEHRHVEGMVYRLFSGLQGAENGVGYYGDAAGTFSSIVVSSVNVSVGGKHDETVSANLGVRANVFWNHVGRESVSWNHHGVKASASWNHHVVKASASWNHHGVKAIASLNHGVKASVSSNLYGVKASVS